MTGANLRRFAQSDEQMRIARKSTTIDYAALELPGCEFDYDGLLAHSGTSFEDVCRLQTAGKVGNTPLHELSRLTELVRSLSPSGQGATILLKDEAANASGSFKARRAVLPVHFAVEHGFPGIIAATSGNYGAAVAAQAAMAGLRCIVVQEAFDSRGLGQPEILEKARACEALGAEVLQLSVGPELFLVLNQLLDETGYFSGSLFTPFAVHGIETLGAEIATQTSERFNRFPDMVVVSQGGGGNLQGTARGLDRMGAQPTMVGAAVNIDGLSMASDRDFNRKSFTTSHTGFAVPYLRDPDRIDLPRNAARPLRHMDRMVTVEQGEVFYATELLSQLEGLERGPAGNTALAAAIALAGELPRDNIIVVQETEYTGAGKSHYAQLDHARRMGIEISSGDPKDSVPGESIVLPADPSLLSCVDLDISEIRRDYVRRKAGSAVLSEREIAFLASETQLEPDEVAEVVRR
jgi:cysteine synthase